MRAANTKHRFYSAESKAARCRADAVLAETCALLALHGAGAHTVEPVAPRGEKVPRRGKSLCTVRNAAT